MNGVALLIVVVFFLTSPLTIRAEEQVSTCLTAEEVSALLSERGGETWQYAPEDKFVIKTSDCLSLDGDVLSYRDLLDGRVAKVRRIGTAKYSHWYRLKGSGKYSRTVDDRSQHWDLWVDIYYTLRQTITLAKWSPPSSRGGFPFTYSITL